MTWEEKRAREAYRVAQFSAPLHPALEAHGHAARPSPSAHPRTANPRLAADIARTADQHIGDTLRAQAIVQSNALGPERARSQSLPQPAETPALASAAAVANPAQWPDGLYLPAPAFTYPVRCESAGAQPEAGAHACQSPSAALASCGVGCTAAETLLPGSSVVDVASTAAPAASAAVHAAGARPAPPKLAAAVSLSKRSDSSASVPAAVEFGSPQTNRPKTTASPAASPAAGRQQPDAVGPHSPVGGLSAQKFVGTAISVRQAWGKLPAPEQPPADGPPDGPEAVAAASISSAAAATAAASETATSPEQAAAAAAAAAVAKAAAASGGVEPDCSRVILHFDVDAMYAQARAKMMSMVAS